MRGNSQVRFLGGRGRVTARAYPAHPEATLRLPSGYPQATLRLPLRLPHKTVMAHGSRIFCLVGPFEPYDFHHVAETGIASPHTLKPRNPITLAIEVSAQFCNNDQGFTE